jgi:ribosomal-protein-serine acetyltransferase
VYPLVTRAEACAAPPIGGSVVLLPLEAQYARGFHRAVATSRAQLERYLPWSPFVTSYEDALGYCAASAREWDDGRAFRFVMLSARNQAVLGVVGFEAANSAHCTADFGYWLRSDLVGAGYMHEACTLALAWGFAHAGLHRIRVAASTDNTRSIAVIERLGFTFEGIAREAEWCGGRYLSHRVYAMLATDTRH